MNNTGITLTDVRFEAIDAIQKLKSGTIDVKTAAAIKGMLDVVVDTAKTQAEFIKSLPNSIKEQISAAEIKAMAGTLKDRDADMDYAMHEIDEKSKMPIDPFGKRNY